MTYDRYLQNFNELSKYIMQSIVTEGSIAVDCTVGNGNDTIYLAKRVGETGKVYGFDIQSKALEITRDKLETQNLLNRVTLIEQGHENLDEYVMENIDCAIFNLGYLPKGDHSIKTRKETTLKALNLAINKLNKKGLITILSYIGHEGGNEENIEVEKFINKLDSKQFNVITTSFMNKPNNPPILYLIQKNFD